MLTRRIFKNCLVALMCLTFVAAGCGDDNDGNNSGGGELSDAGNNSAQDGSSNNNNPDEDGGTDEDADGGSEEDVDPNYDPCNDPDDPDAYCPCDDGMSYCNGECVDVNGSSEDHCGACNATCFSHLGGTCTQGTCICDDENTTYCNGFCIDTETDQVNCGECGNECGGDNVCFDSTCMSLGERIAAEINQRRSAETMCSGDAMGPSSPLRFDPLLTAPAQEHAEDMAANGGEAQGDLNERISQSQYEGQIILPLLHPRAQPSELIDAIFEDYCSEALNPDADAIGVGVAGDLGEQSWVVLIATDA